MRGINHYLQDDAGLTGFVISRSPFICLLNQKYFTMF